MSFIDEVRKEIADIVVGAYRNNDNIHAVQYKDEVIMSSFDGMYIVRVSPITYDKAAFDGTCLAVILAPKHGDLLVYDRSTGWALARRDGAYYPVEDSQVSTRNDPKAHVVLEPPPAPKPALDDDMPF